LGIALESSGGFDLLEAPEELLRMILLQDGQFFVFFDDI